MRLIRNPDSLDGLFPAGRPTAALFVMSGCPFCRRFIPEFESYARRREGEIEAVTVVLDDDASPLWDRYGISVVPTVLRLEEGTVTARLDGRPGAGLAAADLESL
ncbi:MAG: thioredoxin family protein [bacterium]|nr:thioredoxin family protein [bacterium]